MSHDTKHEYRGWLLVNTGSNYYSACKDNRRHGIGSIMHGNRADLMRRFRETVDKLEARDYGSTGR